MKSYSLSVGIHKCTTRMTTRGRPRQMLWIARIETVVPPAIYDSEEFTTQFTPVLRHIYTREHIRTRAMNFREYRDKGAVQGLLTPCFGMPANLSDAIADPATRICEIAQKWGDVTNEEWRPRILGSNVYGNIYDINILEYRAKLWIPVSCEQANKRRETRCSTTKENTLFPFPLRVTTFFGSAAFVVANNFLNLDSDMPFEIHDTLLRFGIRQ